MKTLAEIVNELHEINDALAAAEHAVAGFENTHRDLKITPPIFPFGAMQRAEQIAVDRAEYQRLVSRWSRLAEERDQLLTKYAECKMKQMAERHSAACPICTEETHHV